MKTTITLTAVEIEQAIAQFACKRYSGIRVAQSPNAVRILSQPGINVTAEVDVEPMPVDTDPYR